jgi:Family of unknown function (DUF6311)
MPIVRPVPPLIRRLLGAPSLLALLLGTAAFFYAVPARYLDPTDVSWMNRQDTISHWLGWEHFRHAPLWQLPLGKNEHYGLDKSTSIVFSDSIPIVALALHPFAHLLPEPFQYLGWWTLLSFVLQAYFGLRLMELAFARRPAQLAAAALFVLSPAMLNRLHMHTSLTSHWLLLAALWLYLCTAGWAWLRWAGLLCIAALVHGYVFAMVAVLWAAHLLKVTAHRRPWSLRELVTAAAGTTATIAGVAAVMWLVGTFGYGSTGTSLYGQDCFDLANFFCSYIIWSRWFPYLVCGARPFDWDGQAFLGIGVIALLAIAVAGGVARAVLRLGRPRAPAEPAAAAAPRLALWPLVLACAALIAFAASNHVVAWHHELFSYPLPHRWLRLAETFRGAGRMGWPALYATIIAILVGFARAVPQRLHLGLLTVAALAQAYDVKPGIDIMIYNRLQEPWVHALRDPAWRAADHYQKLIALPAATLPSDWQDLSWVAAQHRLGTNFGVFNRTRWREVVRANAAWQASADSGRFRPEAIYLFSDEQQWQRARLRKGPDDVARVVDGRRLLFPGGARFGLRDDPAPPPTVEPPAAR